MSLVLLLSPFILFSEEMVKPELLAESPDRRRRIAKNSGIMEGGSIPTLSNLNDTMKAEQMALLGTTRRKRRSESRRQFADTASTRPSPCGFGAKN
ncbi:hypothetical protein GOBAR_AA05282 [Gossypium barbadense]|uniref:Uncharacterized protein n=1 Tax=Gossypium barbadense TaxID=3634 RepID=A0A2P5YI93_GOSBA|nr:hypothetical protein GOBAR_AA05282 [Gossypium barbadense]